MTSQHCTLPPPPPQADWAYFLDVDGTLIEIADRPEAVHVPDSLIALLGEMQATVGGACALVSGRPLDEIDRLFAPLRLPVSGLHGLEWRDGQGQVRRLSGIRPGSDEADALRRALDSARRALGNLLVDNPALSLEDKGATLALHYRAAPGLEHHVIAATDSIVSENPSLVAQRGKMVVELKPAGIDKGLAVHRYMADPPFRGRHPVFLGDDLTDEFGFAAVNETGGLSVCIGDRMPSCAQRRLASVSDAHRWLALLNETAKTGDCR